MIIRFRVQNFRSLKDQQELSFVATSLKDGSEKPVPTKGYRHGILHVAGIYGANASGKTNVLRALNFMSFAVGRSHKSWEPGGSIPRESFQLDESKDKPSRFEADLLLDGIRYQYGFVLDSKEILEEWLYAYPQGKKQLWFTRDTARAQRFAFGKSLVGENRTVENLTRSNSLFLSAAAQNNHEMLLPIYRWLSTNIHYVAGPRRHMWHETMRMCADEKTKAAVLQLLTEADLGITSIKLKEEAISDEVKTIMEAVRKSFPKAEDLSFPDKLPDVELVHLGKDKREVPFRIDEESDGTAAFFTLLGPVLSVLGSGGVLCVDELDASLHPLLALELVRMFIDSERNPRGAQLIFNTHDTNLLDTSLLRRDEVWFTEKDKAGGTHLYPLTDFTPRRQENLKGGYLQGRYGAVPFLGFADEIELSKKE